jgi:hypothetical protein
MPDLEIQGLGTIEVGEEFKTLSPEQQNSFVQNVISQAKGGQQSPQPEQQALQPQEQQPDFLDRTYLGKALKTAGQFAMGLPTGLGNVAVGATQAVTDVFDPRAQSGFSQRLAQEVSRRKAQQAELSGPERAGIVGGEVLPFLAAPSTMSVPGLLASGAASSGTSMQEQPGLENRAIETGKGAITNLAIGKTLEGVTRAAPYVAGLPKRLLQKTIGVDPKLAEAFDAAGVSPRLADITQGTRTKVFQNLVQNFPGGGKPLEQAAQNQIDDITRQIAGITKSEGGTIQQTGKTIQEGAEGFKSFVQGRVSKLYDDLDQFVPKTPESKIATTKLQSLTQDPVIQDVVAVGSGDTAKVLSRFNQIVDEQGQISYPRLKTFRSTVGAKLASPSLLGEERAALKKVYGALSEDMKEAVAANGGEEGLRAFNKANSAFARSQAFLEKNIDPLINAKTPEQVYSLALAGTKQGGTNIKKVMVALNPVQKDFVRGSVLRQMGMATPGAQDAAGEVFSPAKFLTEWGKIDNKLNREAAQNLFTKEQVDSIRNLNKAISLIKDTGKTRQTSNNLPYASWAGLGTLTAASPVAGAGLAGGARITSSMMANPRFVNWLAKTPEVKQINVPKHLGMLSIIASKDPEIREDVLEFLKSITVGEESSNFQEK